MCERPSAYREEERTARLAHRCYACGGTIVRGERYNYASGVWDHRGEDYKRHLLCALLESRTVGEDGCREIGALPWAGDLPSLSLRMALAAVLRAAGRVSRAVMIAEEVEP